MSTLDAIMLIENGDPETTTWEDVIEAFQVLIDDGIIWQLQGWYGREAAYLIRSGVCHS